MDLITAKPGFEFIGGPVCLDLTNTVRGVRGERSCRETLTSYSDLVFWSQQAGLVTEGEAEEVLHIAEQDEKGAGAVLLRATRLREAIYHIFTALIAGREPAGSDLNTLNREVRKGTIGASVIRTTDGFAWEWRKEEHMLDQMLGALARSAATLLISTEWSLVRQCANATRCQWLFVDTTKNHSRQWCRTAVCGNKVRARRHRERQRNETAIAE
ncbi:MAG TPA: ABATE domain-containing protein [Ktedonosporobacter sp.]|nr:ABATE domain-containing protein [Ktedonosporobacter sp.]